MMMDDLDFSFEDDDRSRPRRRRNSAVPQQRGYDPPPQGWDYGYGHPQQQQQPDPYQQDWGYGHPQQPPQQQWGYGHPPPPPDWGYEAPPQPQGRVYGGGTPPPQTRSSKKAAKKKKKKRGRSGLALFFTVMLVACLGVGGYVGFQKVSGMFITPDYDGEGSGEVTVVIKQGASGLQMAKALLDAGVIKSQKAFVEAWDKDPDGAAKIQPGTYKLRKEMSAMAAMALLLKPESRLVSGITIPEGLSTFKIYKLLAEKLKLPEADFKTAAQDPIALGVPAAWFVRKDGKPQSKSIEGFLFPDTYEFPPKVTAKDALALMVKRFLSVTTQIGFVKTFETDPKVSPYQALIVASLAQAEAGNADDLGKVARVAYNRVYKRTPELSCACTEMDVTVNYSLELKGLDPKESKNMTEKELTDPKNPYNRKADGLVPTPINNPGKAALLASASPPEGKWYFFVAIDKQGHSAFSETYAQFCKDNKTAVANGILTQSSC